jgi:hypothetical protein
VGRGLGGLRTYGHGAPQSRPSTRLFLQSSELGRFQFRRIFIYTYFVRSTFLLHHVLYNAGVLEENKESSQKGRCLKKEHFSSIPIPPPPHEKQTCGMGCRQKGFVHSESNSKRIKSSASYIYYVLCQRVKLGYFTYSSAINCRNMQVQLEFMLYGLLIRTHKNKNSKSFSPI